LWQSLSTIGWIIGRCQCATVGNRWCSIWVLMPPVNQVISLTHSGDVAIDDAKLLVVLTWCLYQLRSRPEVVSSVRCVTKLP